MQSGLDGQRWLVCAEGRHAEILRVSPPVAGEGQSAKSNSEPKAESKAVPKASSGSAANGELISGYFTLYLRKFGTDWQIVADHTTRAQSAEDSKD